MRTGCSRRDRLDAIHADDVSVARLKRYEEAINASVVRRERSRAERDQSFSYGLIAGVA